MLRAVPEELDNNPDGLTIEHIREIGRTYIAKYGENTNGFFGFFISFKHNNHAQARQLRDFAPEEVKDARALWKFLSTIYGSLPNTNGKMARTILAYFNAAFQQKIKTVKVTSMTSMPALAPPPAPQEYSAKEIQTKMESAISERLFTKVDCRVD